MTPPSLIVVDDDTSIREALSAYLERHGFEVRAAGDAAALDAALARRTPDLIILDLMMPGEDGLSVCRRLLGRGIPILMLSAMGGTADRIVGLEIGAADYLAKPFEPRELLARVRAVLRTRGPAGDEAGKDREELEFDGWRLDRAERTLRDPRGERVALTAGELALLQVFAERPGRLLSRDVLIDLSRGPRAELFDRAVDLNVSRLRRKLEAGGGAGLIETVRGEGHRFTGTARPR
jgi:two-component system, OmpR family, response regulator